jgi:hypothetical protein
MKTEAQFNTWIRRQFYEQSEKKVCVQRIETTTCNGIFDILVVLPHTTLFIESKFQTRRLRPEQYATQIKFNSVIDGDHANFLSMSAYPKRKKFIVCKYEPSSINEKSIDPVLELEYDLSKTGFHKFYKDFGMHNRHARSAV